MLKLTILSFMTLLLSSNFKPINDLERMGLKGKVKSMTDIMVYADMDYTFQESFYFDEKGNLTRRQFYDYHVDFDGKETAKEGAFETYTKASPFLTIYDMKESGRVVKEGQIEQISEFKFLRNENEFGTYQQEILSEYNKNYDIIKLHRKSFVRGDSINVKMDYKYQKGKLVSIDSYDVFQNKNSTLEVKNHQFDKNKNLIYADFFEDGKLLYSNKVEIVYY